VALLNACVCVYACAATEQVPVFIQFNGYPPHVDSAYQGRIRLVEQASIEIADLRASDAGWYECSVVFLDDATADDTHDASNNGTWIYLSVYCERLFAAPPAAPPRRWVRGTAISVSVCLSVRSRISKTTRPNSMKFSTCGRGSVPV